MKDKPLWDGKSKSKNLLWREQGIGDDIIFLGLAPEAYEAAGESMSILIDPRLIPICERSIPGIEFLPATKGLAQRKVSIINYLWAILPRLLEIVKKTSIRQQSYFKADMTRVEQLVRNLE